MNYLILPVIIASVIAFGISNKEKNKEEEATLKQKYELKYNPPIEQVLLDESLCRDHGTKYLCKVAIETRRRYQLNQQLAMMHEY